MKAVVQHRYGGPEQWQVAEVADPVPGKGEVLVRVHAAGVDRGTWHLMTGTPLLMRPFVGFKGPRNPVPGRDLAGVIEQCGPEVEGFAVGDEVIGTASGSLAELAIVPVRRLARKPEDLSFTEAAVLPVSGLTALRAVRDAGRVKAGQRVLVIGASGGVGSFAVQLAVAEGAEVTAVCSAAKAVLVKELGATRVLDYEAEEIDAAPAGYDVIIDIAGHRPLRLLRRALAPRGTLVIVGSEGGGRILGGLERNLGAILLSPWTKQRLTAVVAAEKGADMEVLTSYVDRGLLRSALGGIYPLAEADRAMEELQAGHVAGKVAVQVSASA